jgi:hypothetical protein
LSGRFQVGLFLLSTVGSFLIIVSDSTANQAGEHERNPDLEKIEYLRADRGGLAWFFGRWHGGSSCTVKTAAASEIVCAVRPHPPPSGIRPSAIIARIALIGLSLTIFELATGRLPYKGAD